VLASRHPEYKAGDFLSASLPWESVQVVKPDGAYAGWFNKAPDTDDESMYYAFLFPLNIAPLSAWLPIR
jgi:NADPH-dependent curcumin reductase CurA